DLVESNIRDQREVAEKILLYSSRRREIRRGLKSLEEKSEAVDSKLPPAMPDLKITEPVANVQNLKLQTGESSAS
ncbi:hypothetical protein KEJ47_07450, partial [Candidatus Bathyarchaeota archaeon]|nr:hypothetical protein [Candidatus Bathyarchaeota archaeon]